MSGGVFSRRVMTRCPQTAASSHGPRPATISSVHPGPNMALRTLAGEEHERVVLVGEAQAAAGCGGGRLVHSGQRCLS